MKASVVARLRWLLLLVVLVAAACGASDEELRLAFLLENPMASASLPLNEISGRVEREGDFDPAIGLSSGSLVQTRWDLETDDEVKEAIDHLVAEAEAAGFALELSLDGSAIGTWRYTGSDASRTRIAISGGPSTDTRPASVSLSLS